MRVVKWQLETGFVNGVHSGEFEVKDDATEDEIEEMAKEEAFDRIDWSYEVVESEVE